MTRRGILFAAGLSICSFAWVDGAIHQYEVIPLDRAGLGGVWGGGGEGGTFDVLFINDRLEVIASGGVSGVGTLYAHWEPGRGPLLIEGVGEESLVGFDNSGRLLTSRNEIITPQGQRSVAIENLPVGHATRALSKSGRVSTASAAGDLRVYEGQTLLSEVPASAFVASGLWRPELRAASPDGMKLAGNTATGIPAWRTDLVSPGPSSGPVPVSFAENNFRLDVQAVNDHGVVLLNATRTDFTQFLPALSYPGQSPTLLPTPGFSDGYARLLGPDGVAFGQLFSLSSPQTLEVAWVEGEVVEFASLLVGLPEGATAVPTAVNSLGDLAGFYTLPGSTTRYPAVFRLSTVIPEPSILTGLFASISFARPRRRHPHG